jgi:hypothetical protein
LHRLLIRGGYGPSELKWAEGTPITMIPENQSLWGPYFLFFYVPKGTQIIGGYIPPRTKGRMFDPEGQIVKSFEQEIPPNGGYFKVGVPEGMDGKFWKLTAVRGIRFLTIPDLLARSPKEMLLPAEVVEADGK